MSDVVTGEAVVVEVRVAQLPTRALALLIDVVIQLALVIGANFLLGHAMAAADPALWAALAIAMTALIFLGYPVAFETLTRGRSPGKLAMGLRVVGDDGGPVRFRQALFRGLAALVEIWGLSGAPALIASLLSNRGKRLGDLFAGTIVISERAPQAAPPPPMPPELAAWAATLELSLLPEEVANTARNYLSRAPQLSPAIRRELGERIAGQVGAYVSPPPPPGVPHASYLAAVLAERRRRTEERLAARAAQAEAPRYGEPRPAVPGAPWSAPAPQAPAPQAAPPQAAPPQERVVPQGTVGPTPGGFVPPA